MAHGDWYKVEDNGDDTCTFTNSDGHLALFLFPYNKLTDGSLTQLTDEGVERRSDVVFLPDTCEQQL